MICWFCLRFGVLSGHGSWLCFVDLQDAPAFGCVRLTDMLLEYMFMYPTYVILQLKYTTDKANKQIAALLQCSSIVVLLAPQMETHYIIWHMISYSFQNVLVGATKYIGKSHFYNYVTTSVSLSELRRGGDKPLYSASYSSASHISTFLVRAPWMEKFVSSKFCFIDSLPRGDCKKFVGGLRMVIFVYGGLYSRNCAKQVSNKNNLA